MGLKLLCGVVNWSGELLISIHSWLKVEIWSRQQQSYYTSPHLKLCQWLFELWTRELDQSWIQTCVPLWTIRYVIDMHIICVSVSSHDCTVPQYPANGFLDLEPGSRVSPGSELTYSCEYSHYIDLTESPDYDDDDDYGTYSYFHYVLGLEDFDWKPTSYTRTCQASGEFDGLSVMECKRK